MALKKMEIYNGKKYGLQTSGKYYQSYDRTLPERLLHRQIWIDEHGAIPDHMVIHHKDGDWTNNNIDNLELMDSTAHRKMHMKERLSDPDYMTAIKKGLDKARVEAIKWHKSKEGRLWHKRQNIKNWENRKINTLICKHCAKEFESPFADTQYCSSACNQRSLIENKYTQMLPCPKCGKILKRNVYRKNKLCGSCAAKARWAKRKKH